ncbi:MAG: FAD-dependent oxidoreductase [Gemmatimonadota bacterium]|nr:FAD-dependent oxidoreductase [Gemmatimonadota bacterium]
MTSQDRSKVPHVAILGGGPAGVGGAYQLRRTGTGTVTVLEQNDVVGGNAGSFRWAGQYLDYGSHRLHQAVDPEILADMQRMMGDDLALRERHGRIRLRGKWLHFPLKPLDLLLRLDRSFARGAAWDMVRGMLPGGPPEGDTFASVLRANLGPTICEHFYFPYARKMWGREPELLSGIQARKRVSAGSFAKLIKRVLGSRGSYFYYPRRGYGQISETFADAAVELGADLRLGTRVTRLVPPGEGNGRWIVESRTDEGTRTDEADYVWSTIPITIVARMMDPAPPDEVIEAAGAIDYRAMVLVYLELDTDRFTTTDAHYFPEEHLCFTRLSEPKNYFGGKEPAGRTALCAELPCDRGDDTWTASDEELAARVTADIRTAELPLPRDPVAIHVRRLPQAYPIYLKGYEVPLGTLDAWTETLPGFLSYGRQGLFAHDNTHHALYMAYSAVDCLEGAEFDAGKWASYREEFATHVVED